MNAEERPRAEIVARVLERLAEGRFYARDDDDGETILIPNYGPTLAEREEYFLDALNDLAALRGVSEDEDGNIDLGENWSDHWTSELLKRGPFSSDQANSLVNSLGGKSYEEVITRLHILLTRNLEKAESQLAVGREVPPDTGNSAAVSAALGMAFADDIDERLAGFYARRLSRQFPRLVKRAARLRLLMANEPVPPKVRQYMEEASKCYLHGQRIACLMVCRSAIDFAIHDRMRATGNGRELDAFLESPKKDSLFHLIELAKRYLTRCQDALKDAQMVREEAVCAVHHDPPSDKKCEDMFRLTREILVRLYS